MSKKRALAQHRKLPRQWTKIGLRIVSAIGSAASVIASSPLRLPSRIVALAKYLGLAAGMIKAAEKEEDD